MSGDETRLRMEQIKIELIARSLSRARSARDQRESFLTTKYKNDFPELSEDDVSTKMTEVLHEVNSTIEEREKNMMGTILETIVKNYNEQNTGPAVPQPFEPPRESELPLPPIQIRVDEPSDPGPSNAPERPPLQPLLLTEGNVEKAAKQEAQVLARIAELRRQGLWSVSRLPLCVEPPRNKSHWDFLLEEVRWMSSDFRQERIFKRNLAKKVSFAIMKQKRDKELEVERAQQRALKDGKRICASIAKMVRDFWQNVDKVVDYRAQEILESKKRQALDQHLAFMVGEADKISCMVQEGLTRDKSSKTPSVSSKQDQEDREFVMRDEIESDDESTIDKDEEALEGDDHNAELADLANQADEDMDDLLASLPPEYLASMGLSVPGPSSSKKEVKPDEPSEKSFEPDESMSRCSSAQDSSMDETPAAKKRKVDEEVDETTAEMEKKIADGEGNGDGRGVLEHVDYTKLNSSNKDEREQELANIAEEALKFQPKGFTLETTQVKTPVPFLIRGTLREYQMVGLDWLVTLYEKNLNGILADEMGLGKTIQTISLLAHLACSESIWGPHLIIVPTSVILNWEMEIKKWCPALKILTYFGSVKERQEKRKGWSKPNAFHVCITSYKTITTDIRSFKMKAWQYMILDEAQNIKNWRSQRWQALLNIRARRRLLLTGTPLQNSLMELWSLMHFLMPAIFASHDDFKDWFSNPLTGMMEGSVEFNAPLVQRLHKILRPFILRRLKSEVEKQLPEKTEHLISCQLSKRQRYLYDDFMSRRTTKENLKSGNMFSVLNIVMQLRKCCNHPNLFEPRPVMSPFIIQPIKKTFPAMVFDLCGEDARKEDAKEIPECLNLRNRFTGWLAPEDRKKPTIEELRVWDNSAAAPSVPGFRFSRPAASRSDACSSVASPSTSIIDGLTAAEVRRAGFGQNETFLVVPEAEAGLANGADVMTAPLKVRVDGERVVVENGDTTVRNDSRLCQVVTINGSKVLRDVGRNGDMARFAASTSQMREPALPEPSAARLPGQGAAETMPERPIPPRVLPKPQQLKKPLVAHPAFRATTRIGPSQSLGVLTEVKGFHHKMANGGARECIANFDYQFSPPLKKKKVVESPLISGEFEECVPQDICEKMAEHRERCLELVRSRFGSQPKPLFARELIHVISEKSWKDEGDEEEGLFPSGFNCEVPQVQMTLNSRRSLLINKFPLYVEPAQAASPVVTASSGGRSCMAKQNENQVSLISRHILEKSDPSTDAKLLSSRLQFPELRLIEYDCGKLQTLANLLRDLYLYKHRCLIFTQMSKMLDILQAFLSYHGYQYFRLDGTTGIEQRQAMMERFNADPRIFCFILSTRSGGVGVNLTGADTVIFYDSDWNPTMDAQAQDRCHRIGQTRNVSIYRLISHRTIEENILRKAMQKRRLGEMAIDDAGFTPDFFKQPDNIRDLFDGEVTVEEINDHVNAPKDQKELDKVMASLEDEQDVAASKMATAEAGADRAEFDDAKNMASSSLLAAGGGDESQDEKYLELINQLKPIERYAVQFLEAEYKPEFEDEIKEAEALIEQKKEDWVRAHEKSMEDEGEDSLNDEDFYACGSILDEMLGTSPGEFLDQFMPTWCPPTPPLSPGVGDDVYYDDCLDLLYDPDFMGESKLPSVIHELHRPLAKPPSPQKKHTVSATATKENTTAVMNMLNAMPTQSNYSSAAPSPVPFEALTAGYDFCPTTDFADIKTEHYPMGAAVKKEKNRSSRDARVTREVPRAVTPPSPNREEPDYEGPEWSVIEDNAMLEAIMNEEEMKHSFERIRSSLLYNWEYISGYVNRVTGFYRSPRQCSIRYQMAIRPRETGQLYAIDPLTKKQRKVQVSPSELKHLKLGRATTKPQYDHDVGSLMEDKFSQRIKTVRGLAVRNKRPGRQYLDNLPQGVATALLPSNHEHKLNEFGLGLGSRSILLAEDLVRPHEERHFSMNENTRRRSLDRLSDVTLPSGVPSHIGVRRSAIPSQGTMQAKPPYKIEVLSPAPPPRLPPPSNALPLAGQDHVPSLQPVSAGIPRRVASVGGSMSHMVQQPPGSHSYVVVGHDSSQPTMRVQRQEAGGPTQQIFRGLSGQQVRRTPPNTPMTTGITRVGAVNRPIGYVGASGAQGGSYMNSQPSGNAIYTGPSQMASGVARQANRVVRPHNQQRLGFSGIPEGGGYVRTQMSSNQLRVVQSTARPGVPAGRRTVTTARPGQAVTTMVVQGRPGSSMQNIRTVQRAGTMTQGRLMNVVMNPSSQPMRTGQIISGQLPRTAQLLQRGSIANRTGSPNPAVAHVVIAPPSGMQAPLAQPSNSNNSNSHPPNLTPQVSQPMETAPQQQHNEPPAERVPVERVPAERLVPQAPPPQQQPAAPARPPSPSGPSN